MSIIAQAGTPYTATVDNSPVGVGVLAFTLARPAKDGGAVVITRTTDGISAIGGDSYQYSGIAPLEPGDYIISFDGGAYGIATDTLEVAPGVVVLPPSGGSTLITHVAGIRDRAESEQRMVRARPGVASFTFGQDGDSIPEGDVTLTVIDSDGYVTIDRAPATGDEKGRFTVELPAEALPRLDLLTCIWESEDRQAITTIDVCERRLFTLAEARRYKELSDTAKYSDERIEEERIEAENFLEHECGVAFTGRYSEDTDNDGFIDGELILSRKRVRRVRNVWTADVPAVSAWMGVVQTDSAGIISHPYSLAGAVRVGYEHGQAVPDAGRVCLILARHRLLKGPLDDRATGIPLEGGGSIPLLTPGRGGSITGIPEVDAFISLNRDRDLVVG